MGKIEYNKLAKAIELLVNTLEENGACREEIGYALLDLSPSSLITDAITESI